MKNTTRMCLILFFTVVLIFSLWRLWGIFSAYREGKDHYHALEQYITVSENKDDTQAAASPAEEAVDLSAWPQVDFAELSEINPDIVGWIYIEGTSINYPIVQGENNREYLSRLFDGTYNASGCIFLDSRSASDFSDCHSIIYGHHMKDKSMFGGLMQYKKQEFYDEHSVALLVTPDAYYKIQFFSGYVSDNWGNAWDLVYEKDEYSSWLSDIQQRSCFKSSCVPSSTERVISLSTCTYEFNAAKFVLHGYISEVIKKPAVADGN